MAQIINDPYATGTQAEAGQNLGQLLKTGLEGLAHHKMTQIHREKQANIFRELGLNPAMAHLPEGVQKGILQNQFVEQPKKQLEFQRQQQQIADKETLPFFNDIYKANQTASNNDKRLNKMDELIKTGKLSNPVFSSVLKTLSNGIFGLSLDLHALQNPESQQFEKLSTDFLRDAKSIFGSRLTDADLNAFLKTVPTLTQSNEGKVKLIESMRQFNDASKIRYNVTKELIKANGGRRPANLPQLVEEYSAPEIDKLAQNFKSQYEGGVPGTESLFGSVGRALPRAVTG